MNESKKLTQDELQRLYNLMDKVLEHIGDDLHGEDLMWNQERKARYIASAYALQEYCLVAGMEDEPEGMAADK